MIKVLFIGSFLADRDGSLSFSESLAKKLQSEGFECKLASTRHNKIRRIIEIILAITLFHDKIVHIDVFSNQALLIAEIASLIALIKRKRIILTLRGGKLTEFAERNPGRVGRLLNKATVIQTPSLFLKNFFERKGYKIQYCPNFVDLSRFPFDRQKVKRYSLLWVRAFTSIYNPDIAIKALKEIKNSFPMATLTMIGPDKGNMQLTRQLVTELNLFESVEFAGPIPNKELFKYFQTHEVFLNTTSYESFGNAVIEAAACGIPIVSTNVGEIPYLWSDKENILLVDDFSAKGFAEKIETIFRDKDLSQKLSINARKKAETYDWENIKPKWELILMS